MGDSHEGAGWAEGQETGVADSAGNVLDGEWTDGVSAFPSGNGVAGGAFAFRFNVLPGDVTQDGLVISNDLVKVQMALGTAPGSAAYSPWKDVTGDGMIISNDLVKVMNNLGKMLPSGQPLLPGGEATLPGSMAVSHGTGVVPLAAALSPGVVPASRSPVSQAASLPAAAASPAPAATSTAAPSAMALAAAPVASTSQPTQGSPAMPLSCGTPARVVSCGRQVAVASSRYLGAVDAVFADVPGMFDDIRCCRRWAFAR